MAAGQDLHAGRVFVAVVFAAGVVGDGDVFPKFDGDVSVALCMAGR
jgi:hypothetical protein